MPPHTRTVILNIRTAVVYNIMPSTIYKSPTGLTTAVCPGGREWSTAILTKDASRKVGHTYAAATTITSTTTTSARTTRGTILQQRYGTPLYRPGRQRSARPLARSARDNRSPAAVATPPIRGMLRPRGPCGARPLAPAVPDGCHRMGATPPPPSRRIARKPRRRRYRYSAADDRGRYGGGNRTQPVVF